MEKGEVFRGVLNVFCAALAGAVCSLFLLALSALAVKGLELPQAAVIAIAWAVKCLSAFGACLIFIRGGRALFKGMAAGVLYSIITMLIFALIGGGLNADGFFALELLVCLILGGGGALVGAKFRKA